MQDATRVHLQLPLNRSQKGVENVTCPLAESSLFLRGPAFRFEASGQQGRFPDRASPLSPIRSGTGASIRLPGIEFGGSGRTRVSPLSRRLRMSGGMSELRCLGEARAPALVEKCILCGRARVPPLGPCAGKTAGVWNARGGLALPEARLPGPEVRYLWSWMPYHSRDFSSHSR